jgi:predicted transcriptional regulator of viral defense system
MQKLNLFQIENKLLTINKKVFTPQDIALLFGAKRRAIEAFLSYNVKKGKILRLKNGIYAIKKTYLSPFLIANHLYKPSYISFETALSYYHLIPETIYSFISATTKPTRQFEANHLAFIYHKIKKEAFLGYVVEKIEGESVFIATPEKALADYCYFIYLQKKGWNDRIDLKKIDFQKLKEYLNIFQKPNLIFYIKKYIKNL